MPNDNSAVDFVVVSETTATLGINNNSNAGSNISNIYSNNVLMAIAAS